MNTDTSKLTSAPFFPALTKFIEGVNQLKADYWKRAGLTYNTPGVVMVYSIGGRYAKLATYEQMPHLTGPYKASGVYCFLDLTNGDLLKGSWKAPVANGVRGNLSDPNVLNKFDQYGPKYLR